MFDLIAHQASEPDPTAMASGREIPARDPAERLVLIVGPASANGARTEAIADANGFTVKRVADLASAEMFLSVHPAELVVLDNGPNGSVDFSTCHRLAALRAAPVLVITDHDDETDRVLALELGACDCIVPACGDREVLARVRALTRRDRRAGAVASGGGVLCFSDFRLDLKKRELSRADGRWLPLTRAEFDLLHLFVKHPGRVLAVSELRVASGETEERHPRNIAVKVSRLRRRLDGPESSTAIIRTVHGVGYMFNAAVWEAGATIAPSGPRSSNA